MTYNEFFIKFGASYRAKFTVFVTNNRFHRIALALKHLFLLRMPPPLGNRLYSVYPGSPLPKTFMHLSPWEGEYLFQVASHARLGIVEIGRKKGGSNFLLACANNSTPIYSIDIDPVNDAILSGLMSQHIQGGGGNVHLIVGDSQLTSYPDIGEIDLLFIDGDHSYEGCKRDLYNWLPKLASGGHIIFHDSYCVGVQRCIHEFISTHDCRIILSPYKSDFYAFTPQGSFSHIMMPSKG